MSAVTEQTDTPPDGRRLRVLQMIGELSTMGGAERFCIGLAKGLPADRFETWMCAPRGGEPDAIAELDAAGVHFVDLGRRRKIDYHRVGGLIGLLRHQRFDVLHTHLFGSNFSGSLIGRACRVPVIIAHEHTWSYEGNPARTMVDGRVIGRLVTRFIAVSNADAERMVSIEGVPAEKVLVLPTAYIPRADDGDGDLRAELGLSAETPLVGTATVMRAQKALAVMVQAHAHLLRSVPDAHLVLAGEGPERPDLERQAQELGIAGRIHFLGPRQDIDAIIRTLDVAVMSSDYEGMPLFMFESMANGTPLVATAVGGIPDIIKDGVTGRLVQRRDPDALGNAIAALLRDPAQRERIGAAAASAVGEYTMAKVVQRFAGLYQELVAADVRGK